MTPKLPANWTVFIPPKTITVDELYLMVMKEKERKDKEKERKVENYSI